MAGSYFTDMEAGQTQVAPPRTSSSALALCVVAAACFAGALVVSVSPAAVTSLHTATSTTTVPAQAMDTTVIRPRQTVVSRMPVQSAPAAFATFAVPAETFTQDFAANQSPASPLAAPLAAASALAALAMGLFAYLRPQRPQAQYAFAGLPHMQTPVSQQPVAMAAVTSVKCETGKNTVLGSSRVQNEDRCDIGTSGDIQFLGVYDGHGGNACSSWLQAELRKRVFDTFDPVRPERSLNRAFLAADRVILQPKRGPFGIAGERGIGGSKCGSTGVVALLYEQEGVRKLAVANVGDARALVIKKNGDTRMLTVDHVPDSENERLRIESKNPNPKMPLVRFVGDTWRVGGMLALSRAFGDAYMKSSLQFEGVGFNNSDYSSGFGVIAEPDVAVVDLEDDDEYVLLSSDGLYANTERGGGGGFENEEVGPFIQKNKGKSLDDIAGLLCKAAQDDGSTDDVTVVIAKLL